MGKYSGITAWLESGGDRDSVSVTFDDLAKTVSGGLPPKAYVHRSWWANERDAQHAQASGWLDAGYTVSEVNVSGQKVTFKRNG